MQTVQELGERRQWFPFNRLCIQKLKKDRLARKPDDNKHRVVNNKFKVYHSTRTKLFLCEKEKASKDKKTFYSVEWLQDGMCTWLHFTCCRRMGWSSNLLYTWSCMIIQWVRTVAHLQFGVTVDCEHHGRRSHKSVQHWLFVCLLFVCLIFI